MDSRDHGDRRFGGWSERIFGNAGNGLELAVVEDGFSERLEGQNSNSALFHALLGSGTTREKIREMAEFFL